MQTDLPELFEASLKAHNGPLKLSKDEETKFRTAFDDPEFRKLMNDYMVEMSNPETKRQQEEYITSLENEKQVPAGKKIIRPTHGFVVKAYKSPKHSNEAETKIFVNIVQCDSISAPTSRPDTSGQHWSVPYSVGPVRMEPDHTQSSVATWDVCFHSEALTHASRSSAFKDLIITTAFEGIDLYFSKNNQQELVNKTKFHVLKGIPYKSGEVVTSMMISETNNSPLIPSIQQPQPLQVNPPVIITPDYKLVHRHQSSIGMQDDDDGPVELVLTINLPLHKSISEVNVTITPSEVSLTSCYYQLKVPVAVEVAGNVMNLNGGNLTIIMRSSSKKKTKPIMTSTQTLIHDVTSEVEVEVQQVNQVQPKAELNPSQLQQQQSSQVTAIRSNITSSFNYPEHIQFTSNPAALTCIIQVAEVVQDSIQTNQVNDLYYVIFNAGRENTRFGLIVDMTSSQAICVNHLTCVASLDNLLLVFATDGMIEVGVRVRRIEFDDLKSMPLSSSRQVSTQATMIVQERKEVKIEEAKSKVKTIERIALKTTSMFDLDL